MLSVFELYPRWVPLAKAQQSQLYCWQQTLNFSRRSNSDEINKEFETVGKA